MGRPFVWGRLSLCAARGRANCCRRVAEQEESLRMVRAKRADLEAEGEAAYAELDAFQPPSFYDQEPRRPPPPELRAALACVVEKDEALRLADLEQAAIEDALQITREEAFLWEALHSREQEALARESRIHPAED